MKQTKENTGEKIAIYSRKSKYTGKGESIENQIELCKQYIRPRYPNCNDESILIYEDEGFSGGNMERPEFKKMMAEARAKKFSAIVCYRLDRISRNIGDFAKLIEELDSLNVSFISIKEQFDTSSPMGRSMMYISSVFSQLERETIAERIRDNMHELSKTGRWLGGTSPTGYESEQVENVTIDGKTKKACKLKLIPEEAEIVKQIYKVFLETNSLTKTETYFIQNGYRTKNNKLFIRFALRNILTNPVYMMADEDAYSYLIENEADLFAAKEDFDSEHGVMAYNRTIQKSGKANQIRSMQEWIVAVGKHTGLIKGAEWTQVQEYLEQNRSKSFRKPRSNVALLSGLLFCSCGDYMRPKLSKRLDSKGEFIYSYLCAMKEKSRCHVCNMKNANGNMLDRVVCEEIKRLGADSSEFIRQLELGKTQMEGNFEGCDDLEQLHSALAKNEKKISRLVSSLAELEDTSTKGSIVKGIDELHSEGELLKSRIAELESLTASHTLSNIEFDIIRQMLTTFKDTMDDMSVEQKRAALRTFVKNVVWDGENVHMYLFGSDDSGGIELPQEEFHQANGGLTETDEDIIEPLGENSKSYADISILPSSDERSFARNIYSVYGQYNHELDEKSSIIFSARETLTTGATDDKNYQCFTPQLQYLKEIDVESSFYASAAKSFMMPTFTQIYGSTGRLKGNSAVRPQEGKHFEVGVKKNHNNHAWRVALFNYYIKDNISSTYKEATDEFETSNEDIKNTGLEFGCEIENSARVHTVWGLSYSNPQKKETDKNGVSSAWRNYYGRLQLNGGVTYSVTDWKISLNATYLAKRERDTDTGGKIKPMLLTNLNINHNLSDDKEIFLTIDNIFDRKDITSHATSEYYTMGRSFKLGYKTKL